MPEAQADRGPSPSGRPGAPVDRDSGRGLAHEVVERLKDRILGGDLPAGERLPTEAALGQEYGVSRTVVREAVQRLQAAGLVETFQGRGSFVLAVPRTEGFEVGAQRLRTHQDVLDLLDFRIGVESEAAGLAAERRTETQRRALERALRDLTRAGDRQSGAVDADFEFHRRVALASGNRFYAALVDSLGPVMIMLPRTRLDPAHTIADATHPARVALEHENVYLAISRGDGPAARAAMRVHLAGSRARLREG